MNLSNVILLDVYANLPAAGVAGRLFFASDTLRVYRDSGAAWIDGTPVPALSTQILSGTAAARPAAATAGRLYFATDTLKVYRDNGVSWDDVTPAPVLATEILRDVAANKPPPGAAGRLFFASDTLHIFRDNGSGWDDVTPSTGTVRVYSAAIDAQTGLTATHGLNTANVIVQVFDAGGVLSTPESCTIVDANNLQLTFGVAFSGKVVIAG
jgi:hypothetical protein